MHSRQESAKEMQICLALNACCECGKARLDLRVPEIFQICPAPGVGAKVYAAQSPETPACGVAKSG